MIEGVCALAMSGTCKPDCLASFVRRGLIDKGHQPTPNLPTTLILVDNQIINV